VERAAVFYRQVFGWEIAPGEHDDSGYLHIKNGEHRIHRSEFIGGIPPAKFLPPGVPPHWLLYFYVPDCAASTAKATELGGRVIMGPMEIPNVGHMSVIADPQGAVSALFTPGRHE